MILVSRSSDRTGEHVLHVTLPTLLAAVGLLVTAAFVGNARVEMIGLCVAGFGISSCLPTFWTLPTAYLGAGSAAAGIAMIKSVGNLSGCFAPQLMGVLRDWTGRYRLALYVVGGIVLSAAALLPFCGDGVAASGGLFRAGPRDLRQVH